MFLGEGNAGAHCDSAIRTPPHPEGAGPVCAHGCVPNAGNGQHQKTPGRTPGIHWELVGFGQKLGFPPKKHNGIFREENLLLGPTYAGRSGLLGCSALQYETHPREKQKLSPGGTGDACFQRTQAWTHDRRSPSERPGRGGRGHAPGSVAAFWTEWGWAAPCQSLRPLPTAPRPTSPEDLHG